MLDDFEKLTGWGATASSGAKVWILPDTGHTGMGMHVGFDLKAGGYIIVRKAFSVTLPENYAFSFYLRGEAPVNNFEFKLIDASGKNVWWRKQRDFSFPPEWQRVTIRKSRIEFAWGPSEGRELKHVGAIEFAISSGTGGQGGIWIDDLEFEEREPSTTAGVLPTVSASTSAAGYEPAFIADGDPHTSWKSAAEPQLQWVVIDLLKNREFGGLVIDWDPDDYATAYQVQVSNDAEQWTTAYTATAANGGRDYVYMPDAESRYVRLALESSSRGQGYGILRVAVQPVKFSLSPSDFFAAVAADAPMGTYPKYLYDKQTYWTVVGVNGDAKKGLLNEEGMLEVDKGVFSIEPFIYVDGTLLTWGAVHTAQTLEDGYLPIPSVTWHCDPLTLTVTAFADGAPGASTLYARYRIENEADTPRHIRFFLAIRPFQVNPPWQSLNMTGGVAPIHEIKLDGRAVTVDRDKTVLSLTTPDAFGAAAFAQGAITDFLQQGRIPVEPQVTDALGFASAALQYTLDVEAGGHQEVDLAVPFHEPSFPAAALGNPQSFVEARLEETRRYWRTVLGRVDFHLPASAEKIVTSLKTTLAYILINRDGAALQPGPRNYARSWIRDGAFSSGALLDMGCTQEVRDFIRWYAQYQAADGKVPCCVDRRGPDPVAENDSDGEFIYTVAEYYRYTHDIGFLHDMWPHVVHAVDSLSAMREKRMMGIYRRPEMAAYFGLLPESISHEGYSGHPVHSYWDDFFALRGLKDAAALATVADDPEHVASFAALRDAFEHDLYASIAATMTNHGIDYIPGSVELGDFDPTSTAVAVDPGGELAHLPAAALARTFDAYYAEFEKRRSGQLERDAYTPYELRNVGALIRLGQKQRALEVLSYILADQRPQAWNEWAEVVWRDPTLARFIGDMPHTWVGASFIRSVRSMFAYDREADHALVIGAGVPAEWVLSDSGVTIKRLPTHYGVLHYSWNSDGADSLQLNLSGDLGLPPGGIVIRSPLPRPLRAVTVNGKPIDTFSADGATLHTFPAEVTFEYAAPSETSTPTPSVTPAATPDAH